MYSCVLESVQDVVKLGDFDIGKHEFVYEAKQVPDSMKARGHFKMHVRFVDGAGKLLWQHKRRFKIWNKSEVHTHVMCVSHECCGCLLSTHWKHEGSCVT